MSRRRHRTIERLKLIRGTTGSRAQITVAPVDVSLHKSATAPLSGNQITPLSDRAVDLGMVDYELKADALR